MDELLKLLIDLDDFLNAGQTELKEASQKQRSNTFKGSAYLKELRTHKTTMRKTNRCRRIDVEESMSKNRCNCILMRCIMQNRRKY